MTQEEVREVLYRAARTRMPRLTELELRERVEKLEDYLNLTAVLRAELEEARLHMEEALRELGHEWEAIEGWQVNVRRSNPTQAEITEAKRLCRPELHGAIKDARWLVARLTEQIQRLSHMGDDQVASRIYSLLTGS